MSRITKAIASAVRARSFNAIEEALQINHGYRAYDERRQATTKGTEERLLKILGSLSLKKGEVVKYLTGAPGISHNCNCGTATTEETVTISLMLRYPAKQFAAFVKWLEQEKKEQEKLYTAYQQASKFSSRLNQNLTDEWVYERYILDPRTEQKDWTWDMAIKEIAEQFIKEFQASDNKWVQPYKSVSISRKVLQG